MVPGFPMLIMMAGLIALLVIGATAFGKPSVAKASHRRLESVRERHSRSNEVAAQAQLKRIRQTRNDSAIEGLFQRLIPNPALLRQRLEQTGRTWTLPQYV